MRRDSLAKNMREVLNRVFNLFISNDFQSQDAYNFNLKESSDHTIVTNNKTNEKMNRMNTTSIIMSMLEYSHDAAVQKMGCAELSDLADSEENKITISREGGIEAIINAMNTHLLHVGVQEFSCRALGSLTHHNDENRATVPSEGGIQAIIRAMKLHSTNTNIQEAACRALYNLACDSANNDSIAKEGGIDVIIGCMTNHETAFKLHEAACRAIRNLSFGSPSNNKLIPLKGGIEAIIDVMKLPNQSVNTLIEACKALYNLSYEEDNRNAISSYGGIQVIIKIMKRNSEPDLYLESFRILCILASDYQRKNVISQDGRISMIFMIMKNHIDHLQIQTEGYKLLRKLSQNHVENKKRMLNEEIQIMSTMKRYRTNPNLLSEIFRLLYNMTHNYIHHQISLYGNDFIPLTIDVLKENIGFAFLQVEVIRVINNLLVNDARKKLFSEHNGIYFIIESMKRYNMDAKLVSECCKSLDALCHEEENRTMINREGAIEQISLAIKRLILHQDLVMSACNIFREFSSDRENKLSLSNKTTIDSIIKVMRRYSTNDNLQFMILKILQNISSNDDTRCLIAVAGGIRAVTETMENHTLDEILQEEGCKLIRLLSVNEEDRFKYNSLRKHDASFYSKTLHTTRLRMSRKISDTKLKFSSNDQSTRQIISNERGIGAILDAMATHPRHAGTQGEACGALANLAIDEKNKEMFSRNKGIGMILLAMQNHMSNKYIQNYACKALYNLSFNENNVKLIVEKGGLEHLVDMMKCHPHSPELQKKAWRLLRKICCYENEMINCKIRICDVTNTIISIVNHNYLDDDLLKEARVTLQDIDGDYDDSSLARRMIKKRVMTVFSKIK